VGCGRSGEDDNYGQAISGTQLATGQYITPTVMAGSVQQPLNAALPAYPNFVAGEAVKSQLSPDGTTLAIICAVQNSLDNAVGSLDSADKANRAQPGDPADERLCWAANDNLVDSSPLAPNESPVTKERIHVDLVFSPDGNTLYAAGGNDDAVYVYNKSGGTFITPGTQIALGHFPPGATGAARNNASGWASSPMPATWASSPTARRRGRQQRLGQRDRHCDKNGPV
jgi:hypothetical protein